MQFQDLNAQKIPASRGLGAFKSQYIKVNLSLFFPFSLSFTLWGGSFSSTVREQFTVEL
jgi:hypothetical protein